jgi:hypothetical protein
MVWWIFFAFGWLVAAFWAAGALRLPRYLRDGRLEARTLPVVAFLYLFTIWRSAILTLRRKGVVWRDTFYPLEVLKSDPRKGPP